jgi:hypothetical protein
MQNGLRKFCMAEPCTTVLVLMMQLKVDTVFLSLI